MGGLAAVMAAGGLVVPAWADDDDVKQIPTASADQWHPGWCAKGEEGYSVLIDFAALDPKDRGDLAPTASKLTDAHAKGCSGGYSREGEYPAACRVEISFFGDHSLVWYDLE